MERLDEGLKKLLGLSLNVELDDDKYILISISPSIVLISSIIL